MMTKYVLTCFTVLSVGFLGFGQVTIFSENMGIGTNGDTPIATSLFENSAPITFIGDVDTRITTQSSGYTSASGGRNVFITNQIGRYFEISGINTSNYLDIILSLGHYKNRIDGNNELVIEVSADGITYTPLTYSRPTGTGTTGWMLITPIGVIPSTDNLRLRFTQTSTSTQFRIDDVHLSGFLATDNFVDFCNLHAPENETIPVGSAFNVYAQVFKEGVTETPYLQGSGITAWIGYSSTNTNPNTWTHWVPATYNNVDSGDNDEYFANIGSVLSYGTYYYASRFQIDGGPYRYGGYHSTGGGFWNGTTNISGILNVIAPAIRVEGNIGFYPEIANGDETPQGTDGTLFAAQFIGASQSKSYRIQNLGNVDLTISNVDITGANPEDFTITIIPNSPIRPGEFSLLEIEFSPLEVGPRNAIVSISNNDSAKNPYTFAIRGTGNCMTSNSTLSPTYGPPGTVVTLTGTDFSTSTTGSMNGILMPTTFINATTIEVTIPENAASGNIVVTNSIGCTSITPFTVFNNQMGGCEGVSSLSDLFISEITDATLGGLSYIEIYNGTGSTVNLAEYSIGIFSNGNATATSTIPLNSSYNLENNNTYVLAVGVTSNPTATNVCPQDGGNGQLANQTSGVSGINKTDNGHDVIRLLKSGGIVVDQFGVYMDSNWMDATIITGDRGFNFRRLNTSSTLPNPNFDLNDWNIIDWVGSGLGSCSTNDYSDIGLYDYSGGDPPKISIQPVALSYDCAITATFTVLATEGIEGGNPLTYQWFYNAPNSPDWVEIAPSDSNYSDQQSNSLHIINTVGFDGYQYYVQVRENTVTCHTASNAVQLKTNVTTWNGTSWHPTLPDGNTAVILNGNYTTSAITDSFTACNLMINLGYSLNITDGYFVEIINDVIVNGNLTIQTKGALAQRGDGPDAGTFAIVDTGTSEANKTTAIKKNWYDYTFWSSPVTNATVESTLGFAPSSRRFYFDAANYEDLNNDEVDDNNDAWQLASGPMIPGVGYISSSSNSGSFPREDHIIFNGAFTTGNISVAIHTNNIPTDNDWNFIGNPYPSAIDFSMVYDDNSEVIWGVAYLWSHASLLLEENPGPDRYNFSTDDYAIITAGSGAIAGGSGIIPSGNIPSGQGFFVIGKANGGILTFKNSMRMADPSSNLQFFRPENIEVPNRLWINLTSDNGVFNQVLVAYVDGATNGVDDIMCDSERNLSSNPGANLYTQISGSPKQFAIQGKAIPSLNTDEEIRLGFNTTITQPTLYKLSIANLQGKFLNENTVYLKDHLLNIQHNLSASDYNFTSIPGHFDKRFTVGFKQQALSINDFNSDENRLTIVELSDGRVQFKVNNGYNITSIEIMDVLGRKLYNLKGNSATEIYDLKTLGYQTYIAKVKLSNGQIISKRAIKSH